MQAYHQRYNERRTRQVASAHLFADDVGEAGDVAEVVVERDAGHRGVLLPVVVRHQPLHHAPSAPASLSCLLLGAGSRCLLALDLGGREGQRGLAAEVRALLSGLTGDDRGRRRRLRQLAQDRFERILLRKKWIIVSPTNKWQTSELENTDIT